MGETDWGGNWVLFWWVGPCSENPIFSWWLGLCFLLVTYYGGGNEDNGTSFKRSHAGTTNLGAPNPAADNCWPMHLPETPGHSWASLGQSLVGSLLLSPGSWYAQGSVYALQVSFPQSCISSGSSVLGLMATSSKRAYAIPKSAAPRAPAPAAVPCWPVPPQDTLRHSSVSVSVGSLGPGAHKLNLEKAEEPEIKLPTSVGSLKKQESSRKTSTSVLLTMSKPLTVWITRNCGKFWKKWNTRPPDLPLEKSVCRSGSNS